MKQFSPIVAVLFLAALLAVGSCSSEQDDLSGELHEESDESGTGRNAVVSTANKSVKESSSSSNTKKTTTIKVNKPTETVVQPVVEKVTPVVQQVVQKPVVQQVVQQIPQPVVQQQVVHQIPQPVIQQQQFVHHMGFPQNHIDVLPMSGGMYAVSVDNIRGSHVNYLGLGSQIHLVPQEVQGINQYVLPARDFVTHQQSMVHLGSPNGHLVLSDANVGGQLLHGFQGWDNQGQVMVPVHGQGTQMYVEPTVHRVNTFSSSGTGQTFASAGTGNTFAFARV